MTARVLAAVWVPGVPRTQGSMTHIGKGRMQHSDSLVAWRTLVRDELIRGQGRAPYWTDEGATLAQPHYPFVGPVAVRCIFVRADGVGDIDKLARAVLDALTESRIIGDDVQVAKLACDRVERVVGRGDGAFVLVATVDDSYDTRTDVVFAGEIDGWVGR